MLCIDLLHAWFESCTDECSLIQELMLYKLELSHHTMEATKNICMKDEGTLDHSTEPDS